MTPQSHIIVGTDTDAGKTTLAALLLHAGARRYGASQTFRYWKPVQSGPPDSARVQSLCPDGVVLAPRYSYDFPAAPVVAARHDGVAEPELSELLAAVPEPRPLLVESLGGPLSPLNADTLQIEFLAALGMTCILTSVNRVGAIHGTLATIESLAKRGVNCCAVVLFGPSCEGNADSVHSQGGVPVIEVDWPDTDDAAGYVARGLDLDRVLDALQVEAPIESVALRDLDARHLWHPYSPLVGESDRPVCRRAEREFLHLDTGEVLIDAISSWWTCIHGHAHPALRGALNEASADYDQVIFAGLSHEPAIRLATELLDLLPDSFARVFYSDNGSTAVEVALKIVYGAWRRRGEIPAGDRRVFVALEGAYHGDTFGTMSIGRDPVFFAEYDDMLFEAIQVAPTVEALTEAIEHHGARLAGFILEPLIQAASGMRMHSVELVEALCATARAAELPVIFDEVMTGFGRTGEMFALEHLQAAAVPDVLCLAKGLSGGVLPLAATVVNHFVTEPWLQSDRARMLFHGHSYTANPLACATGVAGLALFRDGSALTDAKRIEAFWRRELTDADHVRILGTVVAFDLGGDGYLSDRRDEIIAMARRAGVFLRPLGDVVYAMPPLCTGEDSLATIAAVLREIRATLG